METEKDLTLELKDDLGEIELIKVTSKNSRANAGNMVQ